MIKLQVIGHLGRDCITNTVNGRTVMNFSVAHSEKFKDSQGALKERTTWVDCAYWSDRTAVAPYLRKGTLVYVEGAPEVRTYQKNDGSAGYSLSLRVLNVQLLGGKGDSNGGGYAGNDSGSSSSNSYASAPSSGDHSPADTNDAADDLPF